MGEFDKPKNERSAWDSPVGTRSDGTSSLDAPTGTKKYSMAAPSAGERSAKLDRTDSVRTDRGLARIIRDPKSSPAEKIAAMKYQEERKKAPGSVNGRGTTNAEQNSNQDSQTADKETQAGLAAEAVRKKMIASQLEGEANAANKSPASPQVPVPGGAAAPAGVAGVAPPTTDENGPVSAPTPSTGQGAASPVTTPPVAQGDAGNGTAQVPDWRQKRNNALNTNKFGNDITSWATSEDKEGKPTRDELNKYGETLGISSDQIEAQVEKARNQAATKNKEDAPLPEGTGLLGGDYRTSTERDEDAISGRDGERSIVTDNDKAWMANLEASADKPKDAVSLYEGAYNRYQKGVGSENGAYNKADFEEMQKIREGKSVLSVLRQASTFRKGIVAKGTQSHQLETS